MQFNFDAGQQILEAFSWQLSTLRVLARRRTTACAFFHLSVPHTCCCWFMCSMYLLVCICVHIAVRLCCIHVFHLSQRHTDIIVVNLINSAMYTPVCVSVAFGLLLSCERYEHKVVSRNNM